MRNPLVSSLFAHVLDLKGKQDGLCFLWCHRPLAPPALLSAFEALSPPRGSLVQSSRGHSWKRPGLCMGLSVVPVPHFFLITDIVIKVYEMHMFI